VEDGAEGARADERLDVDVGGKVFKAVRRGDGEPLSRLGDA